MFHVEFGHYSSNEAFALFDKYVVQNADSLGMNEVEMRMILDFWEDQSNDVNGVKDTKPTVADVLKMTDEIF